MKMVHIAYGDTYQHKQILSQWKFKFHYADKVWVKFWNPLFDPNEETKTEAFVESLKGASYDTTQASFYVGTSVDPFAPCFSKDTLTGYKVPKIEKLIDASKFTYQIGDRIEIKSWLAKQLRTDLNMDVFFRNLEITKVEAETAKAIRCSIKFISDIVESCHQCGRSLDDPISVATGIGPVCLKNIGIKRASLANAKEVLAEIDKICKDIGELGPVWIAKSQIKQKLVAKVNEPTWKIDEDEWKQMKLEFARREAEQEKEAYTYKMNREGA